MFYYTILNKPHLESFQLQKLESHFNKKFPKSLVAFPTVILNMEWMFHGRTNETYTCSLWL